MAELPSRLVDLQAMLRRRELSMQEALAAQRLRMRSLDAYLHAVIAELPAPADAPRQAGPLGGIGLAHKDIFDLRGRRPGVGADAGAVDMSRVEADAIAQLAAQGASHLATLAMAEFACGATGANEHFPRPVNPLSAQAAVGGSSSGSAVAVASRMAYGSLGTDTSGSVRIPAATCGLVGLKTTHGLISTQGVFPLAPSLDGVGLLARGAEDAAQLLAAFTPRDGNDASIDEDGVRMALHLPEAAIDDDVGSALESFAHVVQASSADVSSATFTSLADLAEIVLRVEAARTHGEALQEGRAPAAVETIARAGLAIPGDWYLAALRDRPRRTADFVARHLNECDVLAIPALPTTVPDWDAVIPGHARFDRRALLGLHRFMGFVNYLGLPAVCLPIAVDPRGLPISVQLIGRPFSERLLLRVARRIERRHFSFEASSPLCSKE